MKKNTKKAYLNKSIVFSTVEEQEMNNYNHWLQLTPEERLSEATQLICQVYAKELKEKKAGDKPSLSF